MSYIFGNNAVIEQIKKDKEQIIIVNVFKDNKDLINILKNNNIRSKIHHNKNWFNKFDNNLNHQFVVAEINCSDRKINLENFLNLNKNSKSIILMLDSIQDPQNFGAILRTCDALGIDAIIYKDNNQVKINDFVIKSSMGAINNLNMFKVVNFSRTIELLKKHGYWIYASTINSKAIDNTKVSYNDKTVIIVGNEHSGINKLTEKNSDYLITINMYGSVQSLNVSVATGVLLYEARKKIFKNK